MKRFLLIASLSLIPAACLANDQKQQEIVASCNTQVGQAVLSLGQAQQQVLALQAQVADLQKQIAAAHEDNSPKSEPTKK